MNVILIGSLVVIILGYIFFHEKLTSYFYPEGKLKSPRAELLKIILQSVGAFGIIIGVFNSYSQIGKISEQNEIIRKGQVDERFKNAIEHLGSKNSSIILGGIYSLHGIVSVDEDYKPIVMDILCSFLRDNYNRKSSLETDGDIVNKQRILKQAIINLLFKQKNEEQFVYNSTNADLNHVELTWLDFQNVVMNNINLQLADLRVANFEGSDLTSANLTSALLLLTNFSNATLLNANLSAANLQNGRLSFANMQNAILFNSDLSCAQLDSADLKGAKLINTKLSYANLEGANLKNTDLRGAIFTNANLKGTILEGKINTNSKEPYPKCLINPE